MRVRITPEQATLGMRVVGLEGGWLSHPFWRQRFVISSLDELVRVKNSGTNLFVDTLTGAKPAAIDTGVCPASPSSRRPAETSIDVDDSSKKRARKMPSRISAPPAFDQADKFRAVALNKRSLKIISDVFDDCRRGHPVVMRQIRSVVRDIANTLEQNSAAFASVTRLRQKDGYTYTHSIAVCALMITLGREAGSSPDEVDELGVAGLLHDIGKLSIDEAILSKAGPLDADEMGEIRRHPESGHAMLAAQPNIPTVALEVCLQHHERLDGTGYPFGLHGDNVSNAARIATICDIYDAMTSNRPYQKGKLPVDAITEMEGLPGAIDQSLLFKFMRGIGVFPIGKLVRLRSNRLAVVMPTTSKNSRLVVRAFYNAVDDHVIEIEDVVIGRSFNDDQVVSLGEIPNQFSANWPVIRRTILSGHVV